MTKAVVRRELEKLPSVTRTWLEWSHENGTWLKTLVVEVSVDTDPNLSGIMNDLQQIEEAAKEALNNKTTMVIHRLKVVPDGQ